jgi:arsenate reductase (glutaredoxin)
MPPTPTPPTIQVFGRRDSRDTQKALRFFRERRVPVQFKDLDVRPIAVGELRRFSERLGETALVDGESRRYRDLGLAYMRFEAGELFARLLADSTLLRLPLVRCGTEVTAGPADAAWKRWVSPTAPR